jgi:hypothetical protein
MIEEARDLGVDFLEGPGVIFVVTQDIFEFIGDAPALVAKKLLGNC